MVSNVDIAILILLIYIVLFFGFDLRDLNKRIKKLEKADENGRPKYGPKPPL